MHATSVYPLLKQVHFFLILPCCGWPHDPVNRCSCFRELQTVCLHTCLFWSTLLYLCLKYPVLVSITGNNHFFSNWLNYNGVQWVVLTIGPWNNDCPSIPVVMWLLSRHFVTGLHLWQLHCPIVRWYCTGSSHSSHASHLTVCASALNQQPLTCPFMNHLGLATSC